MKLTALRPLAIGSAALAITIAAPSCTEYQQPPAPHNPNPVNYPYSPNDPYAPQPIPPAPTSDYPLATPVQGTSNQVVSPYKPHNVIDVKGFRTGQLARDPSTAPINPTTGKPDLGQAKIFEIP